MSERLTDAAIRNYIALGATAEVCLERTIAEECLARGSEVEGLRLALREIAICDQDYRPLPGDASPFDWRRRSMKQEDIARKALGGSL